jgi:hypothetical protein
MRHRVLRACLRAYPREVRQRDGDELVALAIELAEDHGTAREALGLLRGGWAERRRRARRSRRLVLGLAAATGSVLAVTAWSASAQPDRVEEESLSCVDGCADVERQVAEREDAGWACAEVEDAAATTWRCTLD